MSKQSTITNLLVIPLIASAMFLSSGPNALANNSTNSPSVEIRHRTERAGSPNPKKGVLGTVTSINGKILTVITKENIQYIVDASNATIMKASSEPNINPGLITTSDIKLGDSIMVRGVINEKEISADRIFDGQMFPRHLNHKHSAHRKIDN